MKNFKYQLALVLVFLTQIIQAQTGFGDDVEDVPAAPINDWIIPAIVVMIVMVYFYFLKQKPCTNK